MNLLSWTLAITVLAALLWQAVVFQEATVCRQRAWEAGTVLVTRGLLPGAQTEERELVLKCKIHLKRTGLKVVWRRLNDLELKTMDLPLEGSL